jgi:hypothetical protein
MRRDYMPRIAAEKVEELHPHQVVQGVVLLRNVNIHLSTESAHLQTRGGGQCECKWM